MSGKFGVYLYGYLITLKPEDRAASSTKTGKLRIILAGIIMWLTDSPFATFLHLLLVIHRGCCSTSETPDISSTCGEDSFAVHKLETDNLSVNCTILYSGDASEKRICAEEACQIQADVVAFSEKDETCTLFDCRGRRHDILIDSSVGQEILLYADPNPCSKEICSNGNICVVYVVGLRPTLYPQCICPPNVKQCQDPCVSNPCLNEGTCLPVDVNDVNTTPQTTTGLVATCQCPPGFSGDICQVKAQACEDSYAVLKLESDGLEVDCFELIRLEEVEKSQCLQEACDQTIGLAQYSAVSGTCALMQCKDHWDLNFTGISAGYEILINADDNPCVDVECFVGSICAVNTINSEQVLIPKCVCLPEVKGNDLCEDPCFVNPCLNGGTCLVANASDVTTRPPTELGISCLCQQGFSGIVCQNIDPTYGPQENSTTAGDSNTTATSSYTRPASSQNYTSTNAPNTPTTERNLTHATSLDTTFFSNTTATSTDTWTAISNTAANSLETASTASFIPTTETTAATSLNTTATVPAVTTAAITVKLTCRPDQFARGDFTGFLSGCPLVDVIAQVDMSIEDCLLAACDVGGNVVNREPGLCEVLDCGEADLQLTSTIRNVEVYVLVAPDPCKTHVCENNGTCVALYQTENGSDVSYYFEAQCRCAPSYVGVNCENVDPCYDSVCLNGGECQAISATSAVCICPDQYSGDQCQTRDCDGASFGLYLRAQESMASLCPDLLSINSVSLDRCRARACLEGANVINYKESECLIKYCPTNDLVLSQNWGAFDVYVYSSPALCDPSPCENGGTCLLTRLPNSSSIAYSPDTYGEECLCPSGYLGDLCQNDIDECLSTPCVNIATCENEPGTFSCVCGDGFYGDLCQLNNPPYVYSISFIMPDLTYNDNYADSNHEDHVTLLNTFSTAFDVRMLDSYQQNPVRTYSAEFRRGSVAAAIEVGLDKLLSISDMTTLVTSTLLSSSFPLDVDLTSLNITMQGPLFRCDFTDSTLCGMEDYISYGDFNWTRTNYPLSGLEGLGPSSGFDRETFVMLDPGYTASDRALLTIPEVESYTGEACLSFAYYFNGADVNQMSVYLATSQVASPVELLWSEGKYQVDRWQNIHVPIFLTPAAPIVLFEGVAGFGDASSLALDSVQLNLNLEECQVNTACPEYQLGPHSDDCLNYVWTQSCRAEAPGNPVNNANSREYADSRTIRQILWFGENTLHVQARSGEEPFYTSCYGPQGVRLVGGTDGLEGRVEVYLDGTWGTVCDDGFDDTDASVICRQLGFASGVARLALGSYGIGSEDQPIRITDVACGGGESNILQCGRREGSVTSCLHTEDVAAVCQADTSGPTVEIGRPPDPLPQLDDTRSTIFLTDVSQTIQRDGRIVSWEAYFAIPDQPIALQIWRLVRVASSGEIYQLISQFETVSTVGVIQVHRNLSDVAVGDTIGIYFPQVNPIPWEERSCYSSDEQLRYVYDPDNLVVGDHLAFSVAPLTWNPCRRYAYRATILNAVPVTTTTTTAPPPTTPYNPDLLFYCSFENIGQLCGMQQNISGSRDMSWTQNTGGTSSQGTGPLGAQHGNYYMYTEASGQTEGDSASIATPVIVTSGPVCASFWYHMYGAGIGSLALYAIETDNTTVIQRPLWSRDGSDVDEWRFQQLTYIPTDNTGFDQMSLNRFVFIGTKGSTFESDIAIDNIVITKGQCSATTTVSTPPSESTTPVLMTTLPTDVLPDAVMFVDSNGEDFGNCLDDNKPCQTIKYALQQPCVILTIVTSSSQDSYVFHVNPIYINEQNYLETLTITSLPDSPYQPIVQWSPGEIRTTSTKMRDLILDGVGIVGDLIIDCSSRGFSLHLNQITMNDNRPSEQNTTSKGVTSHVSVTQCGDFRGQFTDSTFYDTLVAMYLSGGSVLSIINSTFTTARSGLTTITDTTGGIGVFVNYREKNTQHNVQILDSQFNRQYRNASVTEPSGAVSFLLDKDSSNLKFISTGSTYSSNNRALDFSLKGRSNILIQECNFINNTAFGSGGAMRFTATLQAGLGSLTVVRHASISIVNSEFMDNSVIHNNEYTESDVYFQTRSQASGGAIYVFLQVPSPLPQDGLVYIQNCRFHNNTALIQGGTIFVNPDISTSIVESQFNNSLGIDRPKFGDAIYASCNMGIVNTSVYVQSSDGTTPILSYQAADPANSKLLVEGLYMVCPTGFWAEQLNTSSLAGSRGLETFQAYCRACPDEKYSLGLSSITVQGTQAHIDNGIICQTCPYGAHCDKGIWNTAGFWGASSRETKVAMYQCPEDYCEQSRVDIIAYDKCAENRGGTLCGRCVEGYSESLFGTVCVLNEDCGFHNWYVALLVAFYGLLYLLFFMFEPDFDRFLRWFAYKLKRREKNVSKDMQADSVDFSQSGYFQSFMYFIQTSTLLKVNIVIEEDELYQYIYRPQDVLPSWIINGFEEVFSFDALAIHGHICLFPNMDPVLKTCLKLGFVIYLYVLLLLMYIFSGFCCFWMKDKSRPKLGSMSMNTRMVSTVVALFLYTYQSIAEDAFLLLNCTTVDGEYVLFQDGNVQCLQDWQYAVIIFVCVFVVPFFIVLLFGPRLINEGRIGLVIFLCAFVFPLFFSLPLILIYFGAIKTKPKKIEIDEDNKDDEATTCCGENDGSAKAIYELVAGPYRGDIYKGICWEGIINLRRMLLVVCFTFINDLLLKQMALSFGCFIILMFHMKTDPFVQKLSNHMETLSLSMLVVISGTNLVKAAFFHSQTIPRGSNYLVIVVYEWIEMVALFVLPFAVIIFMVLALFIKSGKSLFTKSKDDDPLPDQLTDIGPESLTKEHKQKVIKRPQLTNMSHGLRWTASSSQFDPTGYSTPDIRFEDQSMYEPNLNGKYSNHADANRSRHASPNRLPRTPETAVKSKDTQLPRLQRIPETAIRSKQLNDNSVMHTGSWISTPSHSYRSSEHRFVYDNFYNDDF